MLIVDRNRPVMQAQALLADVDAIVSMEDMEDMEPHGELLR